MISVSVLPSKAAVAYWPKLREGMLRAACEHPAEHDGAVDAQLGDVFSGASKVVHIATAREVLGVALLECAELRDGRAVHVRYLSGERMAEWLPDLLELLDAVAAEEGCDYVSLQGRCGWMRELRAHGWQTEAVYMRRRVSDGERREEQ